MLLFNRLSIKIATLCSRILACPTYYYMICSYTRHHDMYWRMKLFHSKVRRFTGIEMNSIKWCCVCTLINFQYNWKLSLYYTLHLLYIFCIVSRYVPILLLTLFNNPHKSLIKLYLTFTHSLTPSARQFYCLLLFTIKATITLTRASSDSIISQWNERMHILRNENEKIFKHFASLLWIWTKVSI